jgi:hypothetical protein
MQFANVSWLAGLAACPVSGFDSQSGTEEGEVLNLQIIIVM